MNAPPRAPGPMARPLAAGGARRRPGRRPQGMTLVELMVSVAIGLFLIAVMGAIYTGSKTTFLAQESSSRLQENGRFAMDTLAQDVRMAGFRGCTAGGALTNTLNTPTGLLYNHAEPLWGARHTGGTWAPALVAPIAGLAPATQGDILVVRRPTGVGWSLISAMASDTAALAITPTTTIAEGDLLMVADCAGAAVLQATNTGPGPAGSIEHDATRTGLTPGLAQSGLGRAYANDAQVWRLQTLIYFLADSQRQSGERGLWVYRHPTYGATQQTELVTGVEGMAITYGLDTDGDFAADRFARADQVANWAQVVNARLELLLVAARESGTTTPQPYTFNGSTTTPSDRRVRTVMSVLVSLRNAVP